MRFRSRRVNVRGAGCAAAAAAVTLIAAMTNADEVPALLKGNFRSFTTPQPQSVAEWEGRKRETRSTLWKLFGDLPPRSAPAAKIDHAEQREGFRLEHFSFDNGAGDTVYGYTLIPDGRAGRGPAVLYHHYHGGKYENGKAEVIDRRAFEKYGGLDFAPAERLAQMGYVVMAIDAYAFGERRWQGPAGKAEEGRATEWALSKAFLWEGRSLWGMMVRDDVLALDYLCGRGDVDPGRIGCMGMSMGATRSWWLAALDERIKACVSVSCLTRYQNLMAHGALSQHGFYYFVPGMLAHAIDAESVIGCIAPRPHLTLAGDEDAGSPVDGVRVINDFQAALYRMYGTGDQFRGVIYEKTGHVWSPAMWDETVAWVKKHLGEPSPPR